MDGAISEAVAGCNLANCSACKNYRAFHESYRAYTLWTFSWHEKHAMKIAMLQNGARVELTKCLAYALALAAQGASWL